MFPNSEKNHILAAGSYAFGQRKNEFMGALNTMYTINVPKKHPHNYTNQYKSNLPSYLAYFPSEIYTARDVAGLK